MKELFFKSILKVKNLIKKLFNLKSELTKDILFLLRVLEIENPIIIDVGAYQGFWIGEYIKYFPYVKAYLIEPYIDSYRILVNKFQNHKNIKVYNLAFSNTFGKEKVNINAKSYTNSLLELDCKASESWENDELMNITKEDVNIITLDKFTKEKNLKKINILKLDVQGYESRVLEGAKEALKNKIIDLILLEIIIVPTYKNQSCVADLFNIFEKSQYKLYGIYDIEKNPKRGRIQQFDALFYKDDLNI